MEAKVHEVFISYAHDDKVYVDLWKKEFNKFISNRNVELNFWSDHKLVLGEDWNEVISKKVLSCDFAILLVSQSFFSSNYIKIKEFDSFLKRYREDGFLFFPIFIEPTKIEQWPEIAKIQFFKPNGADYDFAHKSDFSFADLVKFNPIDGTVFPNPNRARYYNDLADQLFNAIESYASQKQKIAEVNKSRRGLSDLEFGTSLIQDSIEGITKETEREKLDEFLKLRKEIIDDLFKISSDKFINTPELNDIYSNSICSDIINSEILSPSNVLDINTIRSDRDKFAWYQRVQVVAALSLSLLKYKKIDSIKLSILIDFLLDQEEHVWQRSLLAVYLNITYHHNRIRHRCPSVIPRLSELQKLPSIQNGLVIIEYIIASKLYRKSDLLGSYTKLDFFNSPLNWFLPFFPKNKILDEALDNLHDSIELEEFNKYMLDIPFPDSWKYAICIGIKYGSVKLEKVSLKQISKEEFQRLNNLLHLLSIPYLNLVSEYYLFFTNKDLLGKNIIDYSPSLYDTSLKSIVLNSLCALKIESNRLIADKQYKAAYKVLKNIYSKDSEDFGNISVMLKVGDRFNDFDYIAKLKVDYSRFQLDDLKILLKSLCYRDGKSKIRPIISELQKSDLTADDCEDILLSLTRCNDPTIHLDFAKFSNGKFPQSNKLKHKLAWALHKNRLYEEMLELFPTIDSSEFQGDTLYDYNTLKFTYLLKRNASAESLELVNQIQHLDSLMKNDQKERKEVFLKHKYNKMIFNIFLKEYEMAEKLNNECREMLNRNKFDKYDRKFHSITCEFYSFLLSILTNKSENEIKDNANTLLESGWTKEGISIELDEKSSHFNFPKIDIELYFLSNVN